MCEHVFVRWDNLKVETEASHTLPGYREPAAVRTFDAPEALDVRFYEVQAKSVLNKVPKASRMPFRWTINPYRGCTHACTYCMEGDTPVLMADGGLKRLADLGEGDRIVGTERRGAYRRYVHTEVLAHWSTIKRAFRIRLEDGTELVASGDHRFLTDRGWKHVTGAEQGRNRRPHLTLNNELMGVGGFAREPDHTADYRRGYLCGIIRGDGHIGSYSYDRPGRARGDVHRFRLALADLEPLRRTRAYLERSRAGDRRVRVPGREAGLPADERDSHLSARPRGRDSRSRRAGLVAPPSTGARASSPGSSTRRAATAAACG